MKFHHIGVATPNLEKAIAAYQLLSYELDDNKIWFDPIQKVNIGFMKLNNHPLIELIEPAASDSPIHTILKKNGASPYHTCYEVTDLESAISEFRKMKFVQVVKPISAIAFANRRISFLYSPIVGLIELLEVA